MGQNARTATVVITILTALAWMIAVALGYADYIAPAALGFIPARLSGIPIQWVAAPVWLTPLTATLVHAGLVHLGFNLLMLVWCGLQVERILGRTGVIVLYLVGAYASAIAQWAVDTHSGVPMIGASGAISAVMGAYSLSYGRPKMITSSARVNRWINALWLLVAWTAIQALVGMIAGGQGYLLATPAHIGGFAAGLLLQRPLLLWHYRKA